MLLIFSLVLFGSSSCPASLSYSSVTAPVASAWPTSGGHHIISVCLITLAKTTTTTTNRRGLGRWPTHQRTAWSIRAERAARRELHVAVHHAEYRQPPDAPHLAPQRRSGTFLYIDLSRAQMLEETNICFVLRHFVNDRMLVSEGYGWYISIVLSEDKRLSNLNLPTIDLLNTINAFLQAI